MELLISSIVALLTGITASLGLGGGFILVIYLTTFEQISQLEAQGVNLLFFLPTAVCSLIFHIKNKLIVWRVALVCMLTGTVGALGGFWVCTLLSAQWLRRSFGIFVLLIGVAQLFSHTKSKNPPQKQEKLSKSIDFK